MNEEATEIEAENEEVSTPPGEISEGEDSPNETSGRTKILVWLGFGVLAAAIFGFYFWQQSRTAKTEAAKEEPDVVVSVKTAQAARDAIAREFSAGGTIFPRQQVAVSASISAQIEQMKLLKNEFVGKGEIIATLATKDLQAQRAEAVALLDEARLNLKSTQTASIPQGNAQAEKDLRDAKNAVANAQNNYNRLKDLYDKGGIALKEVQNAQFTLTTAQENLRFAEKNATIRTSAVNPNDRALAEAKINQAAQHIATIETQLNLAKIYSPISGIVTDQVMFQGEYASAGAKLLTIADISEVIVKTQFADVIAANLKVGDSVTVFPADAPDERLGGKITLISRSSEAGSRAVEVWANFGNGAGRLRPGGAAQVTITANPNNDALVVPVSAVTLDASNGNKGTVMTVDKDSVAHETKVEVGIKNGEMIEITSGLEEGDTIVTEGNYALPDGTKVEESKSEDDKSGDAQSDEKGGAEK